MRSSSRRIIWIAVAVLIVLATLVAPPAIHRYQLKRSAEAFRAQVAELRATGEPVSVADLIPPPIADADNIAVALTAAAAAANLEEDDELWQSLELGLPLRSDEVEILKKILADQTEFERLVASAMTKQGVDWKIQYQPLLIGTLLPHLIQQRGLANQLRASALVDQTEGRHDEALRRVGEILFIADALEHTPMLIGHLVATGCTALAAETLGDLLPDLKIGAGDGDADPEQVRQLIARLLDTTRTDQGMHFALRSELVMQINATEYMLAHPDEDLDGVTITDKPRSSLFPPDHAAAGRAFMDYMAAVRPAIGQPNAVAAASNLPPPIDKEEARKNVLLAVLLPSYHRFIENHYEAIATRRVGATALAARWYTADHQKLPARLEDLVPKYLPAVPQDPMTDAQPLLYIADGDRPRVYSVGRNGKDDGGVPKDSDGPYNEDLPDDMVADLKRQPRPEPKVEEELGDEFAEPVDTLE